MLEGENMGIIGAGLHHVGWIWGAWKHGHGMGVSRDHMLWRRIRIPFWLLSTRWRMRGPGRGSLELEGGRDMRWMTGNVDTLPSEYFVKVVELKAGYMVL
jgi:hypothetical protein